MTDIFLPLLRFTQFSRIAGQISSNLYVIDYNCILSVTVFVCHDKDHVFLCFLFNKFTSIVYWKQQKEFEPVRPFVYHSHKTVGLSAEMKVV